MRRNEDKTKADGGNQRRHAVASESRRTFANTMPAKPPLVRLIAQSNRNGWIECCAIHTEH